MLNSNNEVFTNRGTFDTTSGTFLLKDASITRAKLTQEALAPLAVPLVSLRTWDDLTASLPSTAATDDLAIIDGAVWGTNAPTVQTSDAKATTVTQYGRFNIPVGEEYDTGETLQIRVRGGMITTVSDTTATVDIEVYVDDGDGDVGSDLCTTAAQSINSLTKADKDFSVSVGALVHGDSLDCRVTIAITDGATATAVIGEISAIKLLRDVKG